MDAPRQVLTIRLPDGALATATAPAAGGPVTLDDGRPLRELLTVDGDGAPLVAGPFGSLCDLRVVVDREATFWHQLVHHRRMGWKAEGRLRTQRRKRERDELTIAAAMEGEQ